LVKYLFILSPSLILARNMTEAAGKSRRRALLPLLLIALVPVVAEAKGPCHVAGPRVESAFIRRLGRDIGNVIEAKGTSIAIPSDMILGVPLGTPSAAPVMRKAARIWWHTQSKITRKCTDAQAAATFATKGKTSETVTDSLRVRDSRGLVR
jgi:hypothetical protein